MDNIAKFVNQVSDYSKKINDISGLFLLQLGKIVKEKDDLQSHYDELLDLYKETHHQNIKMKKYLKSILSLFNEIKYRAEPDWLVFSMDTVKIIASILDEPPPDPPPARDHDGDHEVGVDWEYNCMAARARCMKGREREAGLKRDIELLKKVVGQLLTYLTVEKRGEE